MLDAITPIVLTRNEAANLERTLAQLTWARRIVLVDSFSDDDTLTIARRFPQVHVYQRPFDDYRGQWMYGLRETGIETPWVLALDADYVLSAALIQEIKALAPRAEVSGYRAHFRYCVAGQPLCGTVYPPVVVLHRPDRTHYVQDGHAYRLVVREGLVLDLHERILHDDRKPLSRWIQAQAKYAQQEADKLRRARFAELRWVDRLRLVPLLPSPIAFAYYLLRRKGILDGRAGLFYASQRAAAELLVSLSLLEPRSND